MWLPLLVVVKYSNMKHPFHAALPFDSTAILDNHLVANPEVTFVGYLNLAGGRGHAHQITGHPNHPSGLGAINAQ